MQVAVEMEGTPSDMAAEGMLLGVGKPTRTCWGSRRAQPEPLGAGLGVRGKAMEGLGQRVWAHARMVYMTSPESLPVRMRDPSPKPLLRAERKFQTRASRDGGTLLPPSGTSQVLSLLLPHTWAAGTICSRTLVHSSPAPLAKRSAALASQDNVETLLPADPLALGAQPLEWDPRATPEPGGAQPPGTPGPRPQPAWLPGTSDGLSQRGLFQKLGGSFS